MQDNSTLMAELGHEFTDMALLTRALTHRSFSREHNERLEFLGDALLGAIIAEALFEQWPDLSEGALSRMRSALVNGVALAQLAQRFSLGAHLRLGSGEIKSGGRERESILADAFEALIAAVYLDSDFATCRACVRRWFATELSVVESKITVSKDAKTRLQEWAQARQLALPTYLSAVTGEAHALVFSVTCQMAGMTITTTAQASSRRAAEQLAAAQFLEQLDD